ncbi:MAG TPA: hypothetical protein ENF81_04230 [Thermotogaceae bacterium]|nr:hypothetical protein [Thermotogota bacterium]HEW91730.1 hypothetical protein [Thermotogaceae bacterium]
MGDKLSFVKYEKELVHRYREALNEAKRINDVANVFIDTIFKLFKLILPDLPENYIEYIGFAPETERKYLFEGELKDILKEYFEKSDLESIVGKFAEMAYNRYKHLEHDKEHKNSFDVFRKAVK